MITSVEMVWAPQGSVLHQTKLPMNLTGELGDFWQWKEPMLSGNEDIQLNFEDRVGKGHWVILHWMTLCSREGMNDIND